MDRDNITENTRPVMVSISCLTYNHERYIRDALEGFVMQKTDFRFEAIVHDDASTDGTADIIREYAEKYPDIIKPIYETENQYSKHDGSLGRIMDAVCIGKYIAYCEGDDYWTNPLKLQKQVDFLETHPDYSIAFNRVRMIKSTGEPLDITIPFTGHLTNSFVSMNDLMNEELRDGFWAFHTSSFMIRKEIGLQYTELLKKVFRNFPYGDMPILLTGFINGNGYLIQEEMGCYRTFSGGYNSYIKANPKVEIEHKKKLIKAFQDFDNYTNKKYHEQIKIGISRYEYRILTLKHKGFCLSKYKPKYRHFHKSFIYIFWYRILVFMKWVSPSIYVFLQRCYRNGKN